MKFHKNTQKTTPHNPQKHLYLAFRSDHLTSFVPYLSPLLSEHHAHPIPRCPSELTSSLPVGK
jgi:hypothetical protein